MIQLDKEEVDSTTNSIPWKEYGNNAMALVLAGLGLLVHLKSARFPKKEQPAETASAPNLKKPDDDPHYRRTTADLRIVDKGRVNRYGSNCEPSICAMKFLERTANTFGSELIVKRRGLPVIDWMP